MLGVTVMEVAGVVDASGDVAGVAVIVAEGEAVAPGVEVAVGVGTVGVTTLAVIDWINGNPIPDEGVPTAGDTPPGTQDVIESNNVIAITEINTIDGLPK